MFLKKSALTRLEGLEIDPLRHLHGVEEIPQYLRRLAQDRVIVLLHACADEPMHVGRRQFGELLHYRIEYGIADSGMPDIVVGGIRIDGARPGISFDVH